MLQCFPVLTFLTCADLQVTLIAISRTAELPSEWSIEIESFLGSIAYLKQGHERMSLNAATEEKQSVTLSVTSAQQCQSLASLNIQVSHE